eukprot:CAMPEP_0170537174 /NCGR_PEP_ID=MMETSP0209-20121228/102564_1 /TAXON_ID=665100 ORGANISM="Litonotus pictus, Strain P1" /NCGR_SAMPLE_ID=MMETSP0209 /ASSEMBLY_ACC=CAM_ASM_000301 /LENGTH=454 /DNA_ID=CAMNT_0010838631 /DNA_START=160 /DNA_END=1521 /DNA_ORIENTATION=-
MVRGDMLVKIDSVKAKISFEQAKHNQNITSLYTHIKTGASEKKEEKKEIANLQSTQKDLKETNKIKEAKSNQEAKEDLDFKEENKLITERIELLTQKHDIFLGECYEEIEDINHFFNKRMKKKNQDYEKKKEVVTNLDHDTDIMKAELARFSKEQRQYYQHLLIQGYDVRNEGIVWIVRRLVELNTVLDVSMFPKFLDTSQVEYVINLAYSQIEATQLKIILKALKARQKSIRETEVESNMRTSFGSSFFGNTGNGFFILSDELDKTGTKHNESLNSKRDRFASDHRSSVLIPPTQKSKNEKENHHSNIMIDQIKKKLNIKNKRLREEIVYVFERMNQRKRELKKEGVILSHEQQQHEEVIVQNLVNEIKNKLKQGKALTTNEINSQLTSLTGHKTDESTKAFFEEILALRLKIIEFDKEIEEMINDETKFFKERFDTLKLVNPKHGFQYDLIY